MQTSSGEVVTISCSAATLAQAIKFLKDNGIEAAAESNPALAGLKNAALPWPTKDVDEGDDDEGGRRRHRSKDAAPQPTRAMIDTMVAAVISRLAARPLVETRRSAPRSKISVSLKARKRVRPKA